MILLTRPLVDSQISANKFNQLQIPLKIYPLLEIEFVDFIIPKQEYHLLLITSYNAAQAAFKHKLYNKPVIVIGQKSANFLANHQFTIPATFQDSVQLLSNIKKVISLDQTILYLSGDYIADNLDKKLLADGYNLKRIVCYKSLAVMNLLPEALTDIKYIFFYSPRNGEVFAQICHNDLKEIKAICISRNVAEKLYGLNFADILIADYPDEESMIKCFLNDRQN